MQNNDYIVTVQMDVKINAQAYDHAVYLAEKFNPFLFIDASPGFKIESLPGVKVKKIDIAKK